MYIVVACKWTNFTHFLYKIRLNFKSSSINFLSYNKLWYISSLNTLEASLNQRFCILLHTYNTAYKCSVNYRTFCSLYYITKLSLSLISRISRYTYEFRNLWHGKTNESFSRLIHKKCLIFSRFSENQNQRNKKEAKYLPFLWITLSTYLFNVQSLKPSFLSKNKSNVRSKILHWKLDCYIDILVVHSSVSSIQREKKK